MKKIIFIFLFFYFSKIFGDDTRRCSLYFIGKTNNLCLVQDESVVLNDISINPIILSTKNFDEPHKISILDKINKNRITFYLEPGEYTIEIKTFDLSVKSQLSKLNAEYFQYVHLVDSFNILMDSNRIAISKFIDLPFNKENYINSLFYADRIKHLENGQQLTLYNWCLQHNKSFVCFDFIQYQLQEQQIDSSLVRNIFNKLDVSLYEYPTYKKYKSIFENSNVFEDKFDTTSVYKIETTIKEDIQKLQFKTQTTLKVVGKNLKNYQLLIDNDVVIDSLKSINLIKKNIAEPIRVSIMNTNDTIALMNRNLNYINFYLDIGVHDITVNVDKSTFTSKSSKLTRESNAFWQLKKKYDTIMDSISKLDYDDKEKLGFATNNNRFDSVSRLYHRAYYNKCLLLPKSFISLNFVRYLTLAYLQCGISKQEVVKLFNGLDVNLYKYPTYIETKKIIEENFIKENEGIPTNTISKPLWNPKQPTSLSSSFR